MTKFEIGFDFNTVEDTKFAPVPDGTYKSEIYCIEPTTSRQGDKMVSITFRITENDYVNRRVTKCYCTGHSTSEQARNIAKQQIVKIGKLINVYREGTSVSTINQEEWINKPIKIELVISKFNSNFNEIVGYSSMLNAHNAQHLKIEQPNKTALDKVAEQFNKEDAATDKTKDFDDDIPF